MGRGSSAASAASLAAASRDEASGAGASADTSPAASAATSPTREPSMAWEHPSAVKGTRASSGRWTIERARAPGFPYRNRIRAANGKGALTWLLNQRMFDEPYSVVRI